MVPLGLYPLIQSSLNYATLGPVQQMPLRFWVTNFDYSDTLTWVRGAHLIKFGGEVLQSDFFRVYDTSRPMRGSRARYTSPMPPAPIMATIS